MINKDNVDIYRANLYYGVDKKIIVRYIEDFNAPIKKKHEKIIQQNSILKDLIELYSFFDGFKIKWFSDPEKGVGGEIHLIDMEGILGNWKEIIYFDEDIEDNENLQYFHPFDLPTEETSCGFLLKPGAKDKSIYYHTVGNTELRDLDLDFDGYIEMMKEARGFFYWQLVLLDLQREKESSVTKDFKEHMPKIFHCDDPEEDYLHFDWDEFVKKYESLRLSKR